MASIAENLKEVLERISAAARKSGRSGADVRLVAVSKTHPASVIMEAYQAGHKIFGENYAQELKEKSAQLPQDIEWHFIGALQTNKVKMVIDKTAMIHSLDRVSLAQEIEKRATKPVPVLIEVNLAGEETKSGVAPNEVERLIESVRNFTKIEVMGLMTMPPFFDDPEMARPYFARLRELRDELAKNTGLKLHELSMGMSGDFETAVEEGATIVRVGTAIFGERRGKRG